MENCTKKNCFQVRTCWIMEAISLVLWIPGLILYYTTSKPTRRGFSCEDNSIRLPLKENTVSSSAILIITFVSPVLIMALTEVSVYLQQSAGSKKLSALFCAAVAVYVTYFFGVVVLNCLTVVMKTTTGQLRPHFLAVCRPDVNLTSCRGYVNEYNCTGASEDDRVLMTARTSFPSGHSADASYMAVFMILYLRMKMSWLPYHLVKLTFYALLTLFAVWCGATRLADNMHHMEDVLAGTVIGLLTGLVMFTQAAQYYVADQGQINRPGVKVSDPPYNDGNHCEEQDEKQINEMDVPSTPTPLLYTCANGTNSNQNCNLGSFQLAADKKEFRKFSLR